MRREQTVAGIRCGEVLEDLSDFLDDRLSTERADRIKAHLHGCDLCERFGRRFSSVVGALRRSLADAPSLDEELARRLRDRLRDDIDGVDESRGSS